MKKHIILIFLITVLVPIQAYAEWKEFDSSAGDEFKFKFGNVLVTIKPGNHSLSQFKEDNLTMVIHDEHTQPINYDFVSSYASGKVYVISGFLFLEYGVGRGTSVRTEYIKAFSFSFEKSDFVEHCSIQKSYYFENPEPNTITPYKAEYEVKIIDEKQDLRLVFKTKDTGFELPYRKEIILSKIVHKPIQRAKPAATK
jgi:hypothetical protein